MSAKPSAASRAAFDETAKGVYLIAATPFDDRGALDLDSTDRMTDFYLQSGADGLTLLGVMGEAPKLTAEESLRFVQRVCRRVDQRVPVIVGVSSPGLAAMRELALRSIDSGADGVMVAPTPGLRSDDQIFAYFENVAEALGSSVRFALQDHPASTGVTMPGSVVLRIVRSIPTCVMVKHEEAPGLNKIAAYRAASERGDLRRFSILTGNGGGLFLPEELSRGADGAMTGFPYPEMMIDVCRAHASGEVERAHDLFDAYLPLARYEQQPVIGLAVRKHILAKRGAIASATIRKPGPKLSAADIADIDRLIRRQEARLAQLR